MSVILAFATSKYGIIASDGRFCSCNRIVSENFDKTLQFNKNVVCGFAGYSRPCIQIVTELQNNPHIQKMTLESIIEFISIHLPKIIQGTEFASFLLLGKNIDEKIQMTGIGSNTKYLPYTEIPTENEYKFMTISPPGINTSKLFIDTLLEFQPDIQKGIDMTILRTSKLTDTVNNIRFQKDFFL